MIVLILHIYSLTWVPPLVWPVLLNIVLLALVVGALLELREPWRRPARLATRSAAPARVGYLADVEAVALLADLQGDADEAARWRRVAADVEAGRTGSHGWAAARRILEGASR